MSRISPGTLLLGIIAVLFGLLGAYIVRQNLNDKAVAQQPPAAAPETFVVPRASTDLKAGRKITMGDVVIYRLTRQQLNDAGITKEFMQSTTQIFDRVLKVDLVKGDTFDSSVFYPEGTGPSVAEQLKPGFRAVTVKVEMDAAVAGFAVPGSWVDVIFRSTAEPDREHPEQTITLLDGVEVLALNQQTISGVQTDQANATQESSVTLSVAPEQAAALRVVDGRGTLSLALRNPEDIAQYGGSAPKTLDELLEHPPINKHQIEIYRGRSLSKVEFRDDERKSPGVFVIATSDNDAPPVDNKKQD